MKHQNDGLHNQYSLNWLKNKESTL